MAASWAILLGKSLFDDSPEDERRDKILHQRHHFINKQTEQ